MLYRQWHTVRFCWYNERWDSEKWYILHIASFYNVQIFSTDSFNYLHTVQCTRYHTYTVEVFLKILCFCLDFATRNFCCWIIYLLVRKNSKFFFMCSQLLICMIFTFFVNMNFKGLFGPKANNFRKSSTKLQAWPKFTRKVIKKNSSV